MKLYAGTLCKRGHDDGTGHSTRSDLRGDCVECLKTRNRAYIQRNLKRHCENTKRWNKAWRRREPFDYLAIAVRSRSKKAGVLSDIDGDYLKQIWHEQGGKCYWLGIPIDLAKGQKHPAKATLDKLVPSKGYVKGNVVWASNFANRGRVDLPVDEFRTFLDELKVVVAK